MLEFVNISLQMEAKAVKNASSVLKFSGYSELETGLLESERLRKQSDMQEQTIQEIHSICLETEFVLVSIVTMIFL